MEIRNGSCLYRVGEKVAEARDYILYLCQMEGGKNGLLQIAKDTSQNGVLDRVAYILRELKRRADEVEKEYEKVKPDPNRLLNYDLEFPELVDSFLCDEQGGRRVNILAFRNVTNVSDLVPLSNIMGRDQRRVDLKTSAWIMGKLLKLLVFAHSEGFAIRQLGVNNILLEPEKHYVIVFDWAEAQIYQGEIPMDVRQQDITQAAQSVVEVVGGNLIKGIPDDPNGCEGFDQYNEKLVRLARGSESNAQRAHKGFYDLVERLWARKFHKFTTFPFTLKEE